MEENYLKVSPAIKYFFFFILLLSGALSPIIYNKIIFWKLELNFPQIYSELDQWSTQISKNQQLQNKENLLSLAKDLLAQRTELKAKFPIETARKEIYKNTLKADLALFYYTQIFPLHENNFEFNFIDSNPEPEKFDILLSKGATLSSFLLHFRSEYSEKYSHADLVLEDEENKKLFITVDTQGALIRNNLNRIGHHRRLLLRPIKKISPRALIDKTNNFLKTKNSFLEKTRFNFLLKPDCNNDLFCTEFIYCFFKDLEKDNYPNPYPQNIWNHNLKNDAEFSLFQGLTPEPSDLLLNKEYIQVSETINLHTVKLSLMSDFMIKLFLSKLKVDPIFKFKVLKLISSASKNLDDQVKNQSKFIIQGQPYEVQLPAIDSNIIRPGLILLAYKISVLTHFAMIDHILEKKTGTPLNFRDLLSFANQIIDEQFAF